MNGGLKVKQCEGLERKTHGIVTTERKRGDPRLKKITWNLPGDSRRILIQMVGDISLAEDEEQTAPKVRRTAMESVIREAEAAKETASPLVERLVKQAGNSQMEQRLHTPASKATVRMWQSRHRERQGVRDLWDNLFRMSREWDVIQLLVASPRILMLQTEPAMVELVREILKVPFAQGGGAAVHRSGHPV